MEPLPFEEGLEVAAEEVGGASGCARDGREDEVVVLPEGSGREPFLAMLTGLSRRRLVRAR
jgi:hypothetical protein